MQRSRRESRPWSSESSIPIAKPSRGADPARRIPRDGFARSPARGDQRDYPAARITAAGGVGHFAAQMAKLSGLKVIGSAGKAASLDLLRRLGVDHVIDYTKQDVAGEILRITGGKGVDLVYDPTYSQASYEQSSAAIASGGLYIRLGPRSHMRQFGLEDMTAAVKGRGARLVVGDPSRYRTNPLYMVRAMKLLGGMKQAVTWYEEGKLRPIITRTLPFDAASLQAAFDDFSKGTINVGKIVVRCRQAD